MKKILIIEDERIIALHLKSILEEAGYIVCAIFNGKENFPDDCKNLDPDIILCDIYLKGSNNGIELMRKMQKEKYIPVLFLSAYSNQEVIRELITIKNEGYLVKPFSDAQIIASVRLIAKLYYPTENRINFTNKEKEIVFHIISGLSNDEIAVELKLSKHTVRTHRKNIYKKLGVSNVSQMIYKISELHII